MSTDIDASQSLIRYSCEGDSSIRIHFGNEIAPEINAKVQHYCTALDQETIPGIIEWVPAYTTITVYYDFRIISHRSLLSRLRRIGLYLRKADTRPVVKQTADVVIKHIPICYDPLFGLDIADVAGMHDIAVDDVASLHTSVTYKCYMNGFMPGFPYLGEVPALLRTPRLDKPRLKVPAGSIGIAESQTGIYPNESPGGWRIIGRTPVRMYRPECNPPVAIQPGEVIQFYAITLDEYNGFICK